jgi:hypothetical protein
MAYNLGMEPSGVDRGLVGGGGVAVALWVSVQFLPFVDAIAGYSA